MQERDEMLAKLEHARGVMLPLLAEIDLNRPIYPMWTIREIVAHIAGWDDAIIASLQSLAAGLEPATPAERGIDYYNAQTVSTREGLDYDHIYREYIHTREILKQALQATPDERILKPFTLPWGGSGTIVTVINVFAEHEVEHAEDIRKIIEEQKTNHE